MDANEKGHSQHISQIADALYSDPFGQDSPIKETRFTEEQSGNLNNFETGGNKQKARGMPEKRFNPAPNSGLKSSKIPKMVTQRRPVVTTQNLPGTSSSMPPSTSKMSTRIKRNFSSEDGLNKFQPLKPLKITPYKMALKIEDALELAKKECPGKDSIKLVDVVEWQCESKNMKAIINQIPVKKDNTSI